MLSDAFDRCFDELLVASRRYNDAPRDPERVVALADARWNLEIARRDVAGARNRLRPIAAGQRAHRDPRHDAIRAQLRVQALGLTTN